MPVLAYCVFMNDHQQLPQKPSQSQDEREIVWWPSSLVEEIKKEWPSSMKQQGGYQLYLLQLGKTPLRYRPMPSIGMGVNEIKLQDENKSQYRLIYVAKFEEAIYVIHVITKKTSQKTSTRDFDLAKKRLAEIIEFRKQGRAE